MNDKLRIILLYKKFVLKYLNYHLNFSKKQYYLKDLVVSHLFSLLEDIYIVNELSKSGETLEKNGMLLGKIKYLNFLLEVLVEFQVMSEKQYKVLLIDLENIYHCMIGWIKSEGRSS